MEVGRIYFIPGCFTFVELQSPSLKKFSSANFVEDILTVQCNLNSQDAGLIQFIYSVRYISQQRTL